MSTCQYYLQGNCRYGNRCRFSHDNANQPRAFHPRNSSYRPRHPHPHPFPTNSAHRYVAPSTNNPNQYERNTNPSKIDLKFQTIYKWARETFPDKDRALDILEEIQREAKMWQRSEHLWRFTSRSLFPGGQPLPDWQDYSFEEVKWSYRQLSEQKQDHVYKKHYNEYFEKVVRQLNELSILKLDRLKSLTDYIHQYIASGHKPAKTLATDVEMIDLDAPVTVNMASSQSNHSTNYTPDDELLEDERAIYQSGAFEFLHIPEKAPSRELC